MRTNCGPFQQFGPHADQVRNFCKQDFPKGGVGGGPAIWEKFPKNVGFFWTSPLSDQWPLCFEHYDQVIVAGEHTVPEQKLDISKKNN